jgi:pyruvate dehydrogenase E2 component (dihydrolipoyllysine-residue acetyltransferase)
MAEITMPQLGETVTEGTITRWFKHVGDQVAENELLFEVSTDKVDSEVPSPAAGLLSEILVQEGDTVDVGTVLARIGDAGSVPAAEPAPARAVEPALPPQLPTSPEATPAPQPASEAPSSIVVADGTNMAAPAEQAAASARVAPVSDTDGRGDDASGDHRLLSPVVRRLIGEHGIDPATIEGTGAGGRITGADVQAVIERTGAAPAAPAPAPAPLVAVASGPRDTVVPFSNIRRRTAEHMVGSKSTSAHALAAMEVDYHNVERVRLAEKDAFRTDEGVALTYLPFVSRAVVDALRDFPELNASVGHDELIVHRDVHLGCAVDLEFQGLMVPVVHNADAKRLRALAREVADLAARARSKQLGPDDIAGGTFTITNVGSYGTTMTFPVINQPQIAILSTDGVKKRPVVIEQSDGGDAIAVRPTGLLALAWDHRAVDGAYVAAFLRRVKEIIETRDWRQELA